MTTTGVLISGDGRMGSALRELLSQGDPFCDGLQQVESLSQAEVVIDFSHPDWTAPLVEKLLDEPRPLVLGTTGLSSDIDDRITELSQLVPVVRAPNTGVGIQVLATLVRSAAGLLGPGWDIEVLEMHHGGKVDAPSGTAWMLLEQAAQATGSAEGTGSNRAVSSRSGETGARSTGEIGVQTLRGGDVVGEHTVFLVGHGERIELTHRCWDRNTFARGGLRAARWLAEPGRGPGLFTMANVLGLAET